MADTKPTQGGLCRSECKKVERADGAKRLQVGLSGPAVVGVHASPCLEVRDSLLDYVTHSVDCGVELPLPVKQLTSQCSWPTSVGIPFDECSDAGSEYVELFRCEASGSLAGQWSSGERRFIGVNLRILPGGSLPYSLRHAARTARVLHKPQGLVEAILEFDFRLPVKSDCLGSRLPVQLGRAELLTPAARFTESDIPIVEAPQVNRGDIDWVDYFHGDANPWGSVKSWSSPPNRIINTTLISRMALQFALPAVGRHDKEVGRIVNQTRPRLVSYGSSIGLWFEVLTKSNLNWNSSARRMLHLGMDHYIWAFDGSKPRGVPSGTVVVPGVTIGGPALDIESLSKVVSAINLGKEAPQEHILLRDARAAVREGQYRRAILDAATAGEMSLADLLQKEIAQSSLAVQKLIGESNPGIYKMRDWLNRLFGLNIRADVVSGLARPRNKCIHSGALPTLAQVKRAIEISDDLVEMAKPSSGLL